MADIVEVGGIKAMCGDCLRLLPGLPAGTVGNIVVDPPYGQTNEGYDSPIAFSPDVWRECYRVARTDAALISFAGGPTYHKIASAIEAGGWKVRQMWGWVYRDGMITSAYPKEGFDRLAPAMDPIVYATKGKVLLKLERQGGEEWIRNNQRACNLSARSNGSTAAKKATGHWPRTLISDGYQGFEYFAYRRAQPDPDPTGHPSQKPLPLMRWLVSKLPQPGPILDPFAGSFTTALAAEAEGFDAIVMESNPDYFALGCRRLQDSRLPLLEAQV